jgi:DNA-binding LytR/AlgR family response regulator
MIKAMAIDDEPLALSIIEKHISKIPFVELATSYTNAFEAIDQLNSNTFDLLFLDIKMPDISGIEFLKSLKKPPLVIFTTAYQEFAVDSYEFETVDYLMKPIEFGRLLKAVNKVSDRLKQQNDEFIFLKTSYEYVRLEVRNIKYLKAEGNYIKFVSDKDIVLSRMTMQEAEVRFLTFGFKKTHRSFLVNPRMIDKIEKHQLTIGSETIPISSAYYPSLIDVLKFNV